MVLVENDFELCYRLLKKGIHTNKGFIISVDEDCEWWYSYPYANMDIFQKHKAYLESLSIGFKVRHSIGFQEYTINIPLYTLEYYGTDPVCGSEVAVSLRGFDKLAASRFNSFKRCNRRIIRALLDR